MLSSLQRPISFDGARVLVIGDLMLDRFRYGAVSRISPEAPVPVMLAGREEQMLGGAGNVLANVVSLECICGLIAVVGEDEAGRVCREIIAEMGGPSDLLVVAKDRLTTVKTRFISGSQQLLRCDEEDTAPFSVSVEDAIIEKFEANVSDYDVVALSDYAKGVLSDRVLRHVIARCSNLGRPVIVDPKRRDFSVYAGATVIKPNRNELGVFADMPCKTLDGCERAATRAMELTGSAILLTLSEDGMALFRPRQEMLHVHATATEVFDVSGAGDTALAIFCAAIAAGIAMDSATMLANVGAGAVVRKLGTATLTNAELSRGVAESHGPSIGAICDQEEAALQVSFWKHEGLRVGFTNGCFDIVHAGHIALLRQARALCDRLVVGLNTDASVSLLKGPSRPVQSQDSRAAVLAAIDVVDLVVLFDEDTPLALIEALRPSDLIKGSDYTEERVVGASAVKADGGRVHLVDLIPGFSTSNAVARIQEGMRDKSAEVRTGRQNAG